MIIVVNRREFNFSIFGIYPGKNLFFVNNLPLSIVLWKEQEFAELPLVIFNWPFLLANFNITIDRGSLKGINSLVPSLSSWNMSDMRPTISTVNWHLNFGTRVFPNIDSYTCVLDCVCVLCIWILSIQKLVLSLTIGCMINQSNPWSRVFSLTRSF